MYDELKILLGYQKYMRGITISSENLSEKDEKGEQADEKEERKN